MAARRVVLLELTSMRQVSPDGPEVNGAALVGGQPDDMQDLVVHAGIPLLVMREPDVDELVIRVKKTKGATTAFTVETYQHMGRGPIALVNGDEFTALEKIQEDIVGLP